MHMDMGDSTRPLPKINLLEEAYLTLLYPKEVYLTPLGREVLARRGTIRTILVLLTIFMFYLDLSEMLPDPPSGGPRPLKASPSSMSGSALAGVNLTIPAWSQGS